MSSSPWPPQIVSLPSRPRMTSLPSPPRITSGPAVPTMKSAAAVPRIVTAFPSHVGGFGAMPPASARAVTTAARATTVSVVAASWAVNLVRIAVLLSVVAYADTTAERRVPYGSIAGRRCENPAAANRADEPCHRSLVPCGLGCAHAEGSAAGSRAHLGGRRGKPPRCAGRGEGEAGAALRRDLPADRLPALELRAQRARRCMGAAAIRAARAHDTARQRAPVGSRPDPRRLPDRASVPR